MLCVLLLSVLDSGRQAKEKSHVHDGDFESDCMHDLKKEVGVEIQLDKTCLYCLSFSLIVFYCVRCHEPMAEQLGMEAWSSLSAFYPTLIPRKGYNFWPLMMPNKIRTRVLVRK